MKAKQWIRIGIFIIVSIGILGFVATILCVANEKDAIGVYGFYLEPEDSIDVVLIGASEVYTSFYSPLAYAEQGFTSYSLSTSTMPASLYKYAAEIAIEKQHPQLLIFNVFSFRYTDQHDETGLRKFLDAIPYCSTKIEAINNLVSDDLKTSFYLPIIKYHSSYDRIDTLWKVFRDKIRMKEQGCSYTKNFATWTRSAENAGENDSFTISDEGMEYLKELLTYLQNADIENVLFIRTPKQVTYEPTDEYDEMIQMIRDAGFDFLNLDAASESMKLDYDKDFYDKAHLNIYGAQKYTSYLAGYLMYQYDLDTTHDSKVTAMWDKCASKNEEIFDKLEKLTDENTNTFLYVQEDFLD